MIIYHNIVVVKVLYLRIMAYVMLSIMTMKMFIITTT